MAVTIPDPDDNPGSGSPGDAGYIPPTGPGTKLAVVTTNTNLTFTETEILQAGGPWPAFKIRVTPINDNGSGPSGEAGYPPPVSADMDTVRVDSSIITADRT